MYSQSSKPSEEDGKIKIRFESVSQRLKHVNVDILHKKLDNYYLQSHIEKPEQGDSSCFFADELERIRTLDSSTSFKRTYFQLSPLVQSMAELLHHQDKVVSVLCSELKSCDPIHMGSFFDMIAVLTRDLQDASMTHFHSFMKAFVSILNAVVFSGGHSNENAPNPELTGKLFETIGHLLKACADNLSQNPQELSSYYGPILGNATEFVRTFGSKTFVIIFRKLKGTVFVRHTKKIFKALSQNIKSACNEDLSKISFVEKNESGEVQDGEKRSKWLIHGMSRLLYVTLKGIKGEIHSKAVEKIRELLSLLSTHALETTNSDSGDLFFVKSIGCILHRCLHLMHYHLSVENQHELVMVEVDFLSVCTSSNIPCSRMKTVVLDFCPKLLLMLLTVGHAKVLNESATRKAALPKLNEVACSLFRQIYLDNDRSIEDRQEVQQMMSTVWLLSPSSKKFSSVFSDVLPECTIEISQIHVLKELTTTLSKLPRDIYFKDVLGTMAAYFQRLLLEKRPHLYASLSHILFAVFDNRENSDRFAADYVENSFDFSLRQFQDSFHFDDWAPIFTALIGFCKKSLKKCSSLSSELIFALRSVSWMVITLSTEHLRSFTEDLIAIVNSLLVFCQSSVNCAEKEAGLELFLLTDIITGLLHYQQSIFPTSSLQAVYQSTLQTTMSRNHSLYQSYSLSTLLKHHISGEQYVLSGYFEEDGLDSFCSNAASALADGLFWDRINVLRVLTFLAPPVLGSHQSEEMQDVVSKAVDVIGLMLELASLPVNLKNEREITRRFETLGVLCRGNKLPKAFLSIIAGFCLGMYRTKFKPVWASSTAVLVTIAQHDDGEDILWPFLQNCLEKYGDQESYSKDSGNSAVFVGELLEALWLEKSQEHIAQSIRNTPLFPFHIGRGTQGLTVAPDSVADTETTFLQLLELLTKASNIAIKRSKVIVGIFIRFLHLYYSVIVTDVEIPFLRGIGLLEQSIFDSISISLSRKSLRGRLVGYLKLFAAIPGPKQLHKHNLLYVYFHELICKSDIDIAKLAFDCICGYKSPTIVPYKEHLKNLFDDRKFRNELLEISASLTSKEAIIFAPEHQSVTFLFIVRILYGLLLSKPTTSRKEKDAIKSRRAAIFSFVAQLGTESSVCLTYFMLRGLLPSEVLMNIPAEYMDQRSNLLDMKMTDMLISNIHLHVLNTLQNNDFHFNDASWDRLKGYLYSLQPVFSNIGFVLSSMVPLIYKSLRKIIHLCTSVKGIADNSVNEEENVDDEDVVDNDEAAEELHGGKKITHLVEMKVSSECRTLAMKRIAELLDQYNKIFDFSEGKEELVEGLSPLLDSLYGALYSSHKTPAILTLLHRLAQYPSTVQLFVQYRDKFLNNCISCLSIVKLHVESARMLTQIFTQVMDFSGSEAFLPYAERIVNMFVRRLQGSMGAEESNQILKLSEIDAASLGSVREEVDLLCRIATEIFSREDAVISTVSATNFGTIILGIIRSYTNSTKTRITEDWVINMLVIYRSFISRMENVASHVSFFSRTFGPASFASSRLNANSVRSELLITYGILSAHPSVSKILSLSFTVLSNLMKQDTGILESRDYNSFVPYMQALSSSAGAVVKDQTISWDLVLGPASYLRGKKSKRSVSEHVSVCSAVVFDLIRCLYDTEMAIRTSASIAIKSLISEASNWISTHGKDWVCVFQSFLTPAIRKGVQQSTDLVKTEFLSVFSHYVAVAAANVEYGPLFCDHIDLDFLRNDDRDQDFFHNLSHIQIHRRARAVLRLHRQLKDPENQHVIGVASFVHILIPLTVYYINSEEFSKKAHQNFMEEITQLIGAICSHLPWNHYMNVFRKMIRLLQKVDPSRLRLMQSVVCVVLDNFHFPLNNDEERKAIDTDDEQDLEDEEDENNEDDEPEDASNEKTTKEDKDEDAEKAEETETNKVVIPAAASTSKSIVSVVVNTILPTVKNFLLRQVKDHKGNKTEEVQTNIAVALTNLLLHLEPPAVTEEQRMQLFSSLVIKVVNTFKSRDSNIRDAARHCLAKMINILGLGSLRTVVFELQSNLREGFQKHVAAHSLRSILQMVLENYQAPDVHDEAALQHLVDGNDETDGANDDEDDEDDEDGSHHRENHKLPQVVIPDFDKALDLIMQFVIEDLSADMKQDRESEGALRTMIREQKGSKFREILEVSARCLLFRPTYALQNPAHPQSVSSIHAVSMPLLEALQAGEDSAYTGRITEALTQVATGLSKNTSIRDKELLLYVHATLQPFVTQMLAEYRRYRDALGKLAAPTKKSKASAPVPGVDDDSDFEIDLPSYLREEESDDDEKFEFMRDESRKKNGDNDADAINRQKPATWLPTDKRSLKDQRAVVEARNLEQRNRTLVQDGASAPKLTGRNRHDLAHRKGKNAAGISKVTLVAIKFCLTLMLSSIKRGIFANNNPEIQAMMVPFIPLLRSFLHIPNASEVVALSIKVIGSLVTWGVPLDAHMHARLTNRILLIMIRHCASISTENELCQSCIKSLVAMFKHFNEQTAKYEKQLDASDDAQRAKKELERPKFPLDEFKLRSLVEMLTISITDITSSFQNPAFQLIKEIIRARILLPEIYDLIKKLTEQIVLSHRKGIRETSSQIVIMFMITYPMGNKRSESQLVQLLNNCNYEFEEGRASAMETIFHILRSFPIPVIEEHAYRFFFPMTLKLINESSRVCRDWATQIISILFRRILNVELLQQFQQFAMKWLSTLVLSAESSAAAQIGWNEETTAVVRTGAQVMSIFVRSRMDLATKADNMKAFVDIAYRTLTVLRKAEEDEATEQIEQGKAVILPRYWQTVYQVVLMLEQVYGATAATMDAAIAQYELSSSTMPLMEQVMDMLLYRHVWVRASAARFLGAYFQRRAPQRKRLSLYSSGQYDLFQVPNICYQLARKMCLLLNQSMALPSTLLDSIGTNLAYVVQVLVYHPELDTFAPESKDEPDEDEANLIGNDDSEEEAEEEEEFVDEKVAEDDVEDNEEENEEEDDGEEEDGAPVAGVDGGEGETGSSIAPEGGLTDGTKHGLTLLPTSTARRIPGTSEKKVVVETKKRVRSDDIAGADNEANVDGNVTSSQRRGLTWIMQRLRAIGADIRGQRRWHVVRCLQTILTSQVLSAELLLAYAELLMEPLVRVMSSAQAAAQLLASEAASGRDTTVMEEQQKEDTNLHVLAKDLLQVMEDQLTPTVYLSVFTKVQSKLQRIKAMKRQTRKAMAVSNPAMFNRMRVDRNQRKKFSSKRKIQGFKDKRSGMRKKPRRE